jgi:hypothetical protein
MKKIAAILFILTGAASAAWAMPSQITFQGTLKQDGIPANATESMQFTFVDGTGTNIPGTSPISVANVQVTNGLFAVQLPLDPTIPWEQYTPYIQVTVQGQTLTPNQPINANLFAVAAIPQGMIMMSTSTCPAGWTRFSALDNTFPMGGATYGATGGSPTHSHTLLEDANPQGAGSPNAVGVNTPGGQMGAYQGGSGFTVYTTRDTTTAASNLPPYLTLIYCQKL